MNDSLAGHGQGQWTGPRVGETALSIRPVREVIAQSKQATISVLELRTYSEGIAIEVEANATTGNAAPGDVLRSGMATSGDGPPPAVLRFSVRLSDGLTASTLDYPLAPAAAPAQQPYLSTLGGAGYDIIDNRLHTRQILWLWPLPASDEFELVAEWPIFDIAATRVSLNVREMGI